jgi:hypothetical protein
MVMEVNAKPVGVLKNQRADGQYVSMGYVPLIVKLVRDNII